MKERYESQLRIRWQEPAHYQGAWDELKEGKNADTFASVVAAAKLAVAQGGTFIVYRESDTAIMRRCDRMSELEDEIGKAAST